MYWFSIKEECIAFAIEVTFPFTVGLDLFLCYAPSVWKNREHTLV